VIAHLVLFRPRPTLTEVERADFIRVLDEALNGIPQIRRVTLGRRLLLGRQYDAMNAMDFPFVAILEFESNADLAAYLEHPAHERLGLQFYTASEAALAFDFDLLDASRTHELLS
jgi:hypothetical protein